MARLCSCGADDIFHVQEFRPEYQADYATLNFGMHAAAVSS
jgi:hypothetical protein